MDNLIRNAISIAIVVGVITLIIVSCVTSGSTVTDPADSTHIVVESGSFTDSSNINQNFIQLMMRKFIYGQTLKRVFNTSFIIISVVMLV